MCVCVCTFIINMLVQLESSASKQVTPFGVDRLTKLLSEAPLSLASPCRTLHFYELYQNHGLSPGVLFDIMSHQVHSLDYMVWS
jgi:hypothetical protein